MKVFLKKISTAILLLIYSNNLLFASNDLSDITFESVESVKISQQILETYDSLCRSQCNATLTDSILVVQNNSSNELLAYIYSRYTTLDPIQLSSSSSISIILTEQGYYQIDLSGYRICNSAGYFEYIKGHTDTIKVEFGPVLPTDGPEESSPDPLDPNQFAATLNDSILVIHNNSLQSVLTTIYWQEIDEISSHILGDSLTIALTKPGEYKILISNSEYSIMAKFTYISSDSISDVNEIPTIIHSQHHQKRLDNGIFLIHTSEGQSYDAVGREL